MIIGMDFGTTNSGMAVYDGHDLQLMPLDPANRNPHVARTALYLTNDRRVYIGRGAIDQYYEENLNRPSRYERVHVGEIEQTFAELPTFIRDVYIEKDIYSPGRLFVSFKMGLSSPNYTGTIVGSQYFFLEDIIATYLYIAKQRAERVLDRELDSIVLGRPVRFSENSEHNEYARERLIKAAFRAGYKTVYLQYEPIAAAYYYETTIQKEENVLIFDFGGGTLDLSLVRLGNPKTRRVIANGGIAIAGDIFDQRIVRAKYPPHFGEGTSYLAGNNEMPMPASFYDAFSDWQSLLNLQTLNTMDKLKQMQTTARQPQKIKALLQLITGQYGLKMYDIAEATKRQLSDLAIARLDMQGEGFRVFEALSRTEFERIIRSDTNAIEKRLDEVMREAGLNYSDVDAVIRTGGSSQIPVFVQMLEEKFGAEKVRSIDSFSSVTSGLGVIGHKIETGEISAQAYHVESFKGGEKLAHDKQQRVPAVDLQVLKRLISAQEYRETSAEVYASILVQDDEQDIQALALVDSSREIALAELGLAKLSPESFLVPAPSDEKLVLVTTDYTALVKTPAELADLRRIGLTLAQLEGFRHDAFSSEYVYSLCTLTSLHEAPYVVSISSLGYAQKFIGERLVERLDRSVNYQFASTRGYLAALLALNEGDDFIAISQAGRAMRMPLQKISLKESRVLNVPLKGRILATFSLQQTPQVLLASANGELEQVRLDKLPRTLEMNTNGAKITSRASIVAALAYQPDKTLWALTTQRFAPYQDLHLKKGEKLVNLAYL